jgi:hypothetical protein
MLRQGFNDVHASWYREVMIFEDIIRHLRPVWVSKCPNSLTVFFFVIIVVIDVVSVIVISWYNIKAFITCGKFQTLYIE